MVGQGLLVGKPVIDILNQWRQEVSVFSNKTSLDGEGGRRSDSGNGRAQAGFSGDA